MIKPFPAGLSFSSSRGLVIFLLETIWDGRDREESSGRQQGLLGMGQQQDGGDGTMHHTAPSSLWLQVAGTGFGYSFHGSFLPSPRLTELHHFGACWLLGCLHGRWEVCQEDWLGKGKHGKSCLRAVRPQGQRLTPRPVCTPLRLGAPGSPCQGCRRTDPGSHARPTVRWICPGRTGRT